MYFIYFYIRYFKNYFVSLSDYFASVIFKSYFIFSTNIVVNDPKPLTSDNARKEKQSEFPLWKELWILSFNCDVSLNFALVYNLGLLQRPLKTITYKCPISGYANMACTVPSILSS